MGLNLVELPYLIFRIAPIILVSFFVLQSFLMQDLKGIIYIAGLLLTCLITLFANSILTSMYPIEKNIKNPRCLTISVGENGEYYSDIPLNLVTYSYTFFYLFIFILNLANTNTSKGILERKKIKQVGINNALKQNIPILLFFPILILAELWWSSSNKCISDKINIFFLYATSAIILGGIGGMIWAAVVTSLGVPSLQYIVSNREDVCSRPAKTLFRCKPKESV